MKILILGAYGMLGHKLFLTLSKRFDLFATCRIFHKKWSHILPKERLFADVHADNFDSVIGAVQSVAPDVVINCIGIVKQLEVAKDPIPSITINALFPQQLAAVCRSLGTRLIHFSTDCVFRGNKGSYVEDDPSYATDLYGRTKFLGEVNEPNCVTFRTSIIGHELKSKHGLVDWFLSQKSKGRGFTRAIYTGFPTVELARIITDYVIPNRELSGLYHVSSDPISKYDLLRLVAKQYNKQIEIEPDGDLHCDRSLDSKRFRTATGYSPPSWEELVTLMHDDFMKIEEEINHGNI